MCCFKSHGSLPCKKWEWHEPTSVEAIAWCKAVTSQYLKQWWHIHGSIYASGLIKTGLFLVQHQTITLKIDGLQWVNKTGSWCYFDAYFLILMLLPINPASHIAGKYIPDLHCEHDKNTTVIDTWMTIFLRFIKFTILRYSKCHDISKGLIWTKI